MKFHLVGLSGWAGTGKDSVAAVLAECGGFQRHSFADALRAEICEAFGIEALYLTRRDLKEVPSPALALRQCRDFGFLGAAALAHPSGSFFLRDFLDQPRSAREVMQLWGTEYRRRQNPAYWTRIMVDKISTGRKNGLRHFVITDVRFPNECETVKLMGGTIWQVVRPGVEPVNGHSSENDGAQFAPSHVISNDGDLKQLRSVCLAAYWKLETGLDASELVAANK